MSDSNLFNSAPQFGTAEYESTSDTDVCNSCKQPIAGNYYRINGVLICERCTEQLKGKLPKDTHAAFVRGILFGIGGAILGLILYAGFGIITGILLGYISLAVGFIVGKAIRLGSGGVGGRRYQVVAVLLTYAAVSMAAIPIGISLYLKDKDKHPPRVASQPSSVAPSPSGSQDSSAPSGTATGSQQRNNGPQLGFGKAFLALALVGLASPFLALKDAFHGIIGLVILFVGIRIAWQITAAPKIDIVGPFSGRSAEPSPAR